MAGLYTHAYIYIQDYVISYPWPQVQGCTGDVGWTSSLNGMNWLVSKGDPAKHGSNRSLDIIDSTEYSTYWDPYCSAPTKWRWTNSNLGQITTLYVYIFTYLLYLLTKIKTIIA